MNTSNTKLLRPSDLALLLLSAGSAPPRKRARDQQADRAGLELKQRILNCLVALDPEPDELDAALLHIVEEFGSPTGPARAIAVTIRDEWQAAQADPTFIEHLLADAVAANDHPCEDK